MKTDKKDSIKDEITNDNKSCKIIEPVDTLKKSIFEDIKLKDLLPKHAHICEECD